MNQLPNIVLMFALIYSPLCLQGRVGPYNVKARWQLFGGKLVTQIESIIQFFFLQMSKSCNWSYKNITNH